MGPATYTLNSLGVAQPSPSTPTQAAHVVHEIGTGREEPLHNRLPDDRERHQRLQPRKSAWRPRQRRSIRLWLRPARMGSSHPSNDNLWSIPEHG